jgi:hypothetical protein
MGKKKQSDEPQKKRGNRGDFHGKRLEFLESKVELFCEHSEKKTTRTWWDKLWGEWWAEFPWDVPLNQDPLPGAKAKPDKELTPEEKDQKAKILTDTENVSAFNGVIRVWEAKSTR